MTETRLFCINHGFKTILYSLITVICYEYIQYLQKMTETKLYFTKNDGYQTLLYV